MPSASQPLRQWGDDHRDLFLELVRIFLGVALFVRGVWFIGHVPTLQELMAGTRTALGTTVIAHYVIVAHLVGGALIAIGLLTRTAALFNLPVLLGAIAVVHWREGLFRASGSMELAVLTAFLLLVFALAGAGEWSVEALLRRRAAAGPPDHVPDDEVEEPLGPPFSPTPR